MVRAMTAIVLVAGAFIASPCEAAWDWITRSDDGLMNLSGDRSSIVPHGHLTQVRLLFDYAHRQINPWPMAWHVAERRQCDVGIGARDVVAGDVRDNDNAA